MIRVLFFASVREQLECSGLDLDWPVKDGMTLDVLCSQIASRGPVWAQVLGQDNLICAVNQAVVDGNPNLADGDEVAFFPPVTGG